MSRIKNKEAINKLLDDPDNYGQADRNNALVVRIQDIALEVKDAKGFEKEYGKLVKLFKDDRRISNDTRLYVGSIADIIKSLISKGRVDYVTSGIDKIVERAKQRRDDYYGKKAKGKEKEMEKIYDKHGDALDKAAYKKGTYLDTRNKGGAPKTVNKEVRPKIQWEIEFKDMPGVDDHVANGKDLFKDVLAGKSGSVLKQGMSPSADQKLQIAAIQMKLGIDIDGKYGPATKKAVEDFQDANGLTTDGRVGRQTITAMFSDTAKLVAKQIPITGKNADANIIKTIENLTKDRDYLYITKNNNKPQELKDKNENVYRLNESKIRRLIRSSIRRQLR